MQKEKCIEARSNISIYSLICYCSFYLSWYSLALGKPKVAYLMSAVCFTSNFIGQLSNWISFIFKIRWTGHE